MAGLKSKIWFILKPSFKRDGPKKPHHIHAKSVWGKKEVFLTSCSSRGWLQALDALWWNHTDIFANGTSLEQGKLKVQNHLVWWQGQFKQFSFFPPDNCPPHTHCHFPNGAAFGVVTKQIGCIYKRLWDGFVKHLPLFRSALTRQKRRTAEKKRKKFFTTKAPLAPSPDVLGALKTCQETALQTGGKAEGEKPRIILEL